MKQKNTKTCDPETMLVIGFFIGLGVICLALLFSLWEDKQDMINTKAIGIILCKEQGMEYDYREIVSIQIDGKDYKSIPKIYCKALEQKEIELIDGMVVTQDQIKKEGMVIK